MNHEANEALAYGMKNKHISGAFEWTSDAEARAIRDEWRRHCEMIREQEAHDANENTAALVTAGVVGGLLGLMFVLGCLVWGSK